MPAHRYQKFLGSSVTFDSEAWGQVTVESISISPAIDGDAAVFYGPVTDFERPVVRVHSECFFSEILGIDTCDCAKQFRDTLEQFRIFGHGLLIYLRFDGRDVGLPAKIQATKLELSGLDTHQSRVTLGLEPDARSYRGIGKYLLSKGISKIHLLTNNPQKEEAIKEEGVGVETIPLISDVDHPEAVKLLRTKKNKFKHKI